MALFPTKISEGGCLRQQRFAAAGNFCGLSLLLFDREMCLDRRLKSAGPFIV
jgi:hypothetical protein